MICVRDDRSLSLSCITYKWQFIFKANRLFSNVITYGQMISPGNVHFHDIIIDIKRADVEHLNSFKIRIVIALACSFNRILNDIENQNACKMEYLILKCS